MGHTNVQDIVYNPNSGVVMVCGPIDWERPQANGAEIWPDGAHPKRMSIEVTLKNGQDVVIATGNSGVYEQGTADGPWSAAMLLDSEVTEPIDNELVKSVGKKTYPDYPDDPVINAASETIWIDKDLHFKHR